MQEEIEKALEKNKVLFGIRQCVREFKKGNAGKVFLASDARKETEDKLNKLKIPFNKIHFSAEEIAKKLKINFISEIFLIKGKGLKEKKDKNKREKVVKKKEKQARK